MKKIRVLVIDDSAVIRRVLTEVLSSDPDIEVIGTAANAATALAKVEQLQPDIITLDVELPDRSGLDVLVDIRRKSPRVPVVMFSSLTRKAAATTLDALARGATDYVTKPENMQSYEAALEHVRNELLRKVKALGGHTPSVQAVSAPVVAGRMLEPRADVVAIGVSTGGPNALADLMAGIKGPLPVPLLIVQHMPALFTQLLAERLSASTGHRVSEAKHGEELVAGRVYIAPGNFHMHVERRGTKPTLVVDQGAPENSCRPAVDVLFRSVARTYGSRCLAVVLTGMGQDGLRGCEAIRAAGGQIIAQDEATSVVWGMPGFIARNGLADRVLPLPSIAGEIARAVSYVSRHEAGGLHHVA